MAAAVAVSVSGCTLMPDEANPVEWYKGTRNWLSDSKTPAQKALEKAARETPISGGDRPFPNLSTVPPRPVLHGKPESETGDELRRDGEDARESDAVMRAREDAAHRATIRPSTAPPAAKKALKAVTEPKIMPRKLPKLTRPPPPPSVDDPVPADGTDETLKKKSSVIDRRNSKPNSTMI